MTVSIVNTDHYVLTVTIDAISYVISKPTIFLASDEPYLYFNWSQFNKNKLVQNQFVIDFNDVTAPVCVSAADLLTQVQAFIYSPISGGPIATVSNTQTVELVIDLMDDLTATAIPIDYNNVFLLGGS